MNTHYEYYELYQILEDGDLDHKDALRIRTNHNTYDKLLDAYNISEYYTPYELEIKKYLQENFKEVYDIFKEKNPDIDFDDINIEISLISKNRYREFDSDFDGQCKLIDIIIEDQETIDKHININKELLLNSGFEIFISEGGYEFYTIDIDNFHITANNNFNNAGLYNVHVDNDRYETIGGVDISNVWQFNKFMEIFNCKFKLIY